MAGAVFLAGFCSVAAAVETKAGGSAAAVETKPSGSAAAVEAKSGRGSAAVEAKPSGSAAAVEAKSGRGSAADEAKPSGSAAAVETKSSGEKGEVLVLGSSSFWRTHYTLAPPVRREGGAVRKAEFQAKWLERETPPPDGGWMRSDFDDSSWDRSPAFNAGSPFIAQISMRGKFHITEPAQAKGMKLSISYEGGVIVRLNGAELARGHLPKDADLAAGSLAEDYPEEAKGGELVRLLNDISIPEKSLRGGANVLAIEVRRSAHRAKDFAVEGRNLLIDFPACALLSVRLTAPAGAATTPDVTRPKGLQVWNSDPAASDFDLDWGDPNEPLRPIRLVGARNGVASGKVVVGSTAPIKGLGATVSALTQKGGAGRIPAGAVEIRYALATSSEGESELRYTLAASRFDALEEAPPAEVPLAVKRPGHTSRKLPDEPAPVPGAVCPVWVTVNVPADAPPGDYSGRLEISASGEKPVPVPIELDVSPWKIPDPERFQTFVELVESPETLAMRYDAPLWSDRHFELLARSLRLLRRVGNRTCHVMLIADTNQGNDETMVRWIRQPDGTYKYDFTVMDKYLDAVEKNQGRPEVVCLYVWDTYLEGGVGGAMQWAGEAVKQGRIAHQGHGPLVTLVDAATGKAEKGELPSYLAPESRALWEPLMREVVERLRKRGLEKAAMLGIGTDNIPTKEVVAFFKAVAPGLPWVSHSHPYRTDIEGVPTGYASGVWSGGEFARDPSAGRSYGWKRKDLAVHFPRSTFDYWPQTTWRFEGEMNIAGNQRGFARFGGDFFGVLKDQRGYTRGSLSARFPKTSWRNLDIRSCLLAPGRDGAISTARFEMMREGLQECEARIAIECALTDPALRAKLGEPLATRAQTLLDERTRDMRRAVSTLRSTGAWTSHAQIDNTWWQAPGVLGAHWFVSSGWQQKTAALYDTAAEVERAGK